MPNRNIPENAVIIDNGIARATIKPGPQVAEEQEQNGDDQQAALEQVRPHGVDDVVHQFGAVVEHLHLDAGRQGLPSPRRVSPAAGA